MLKSKKSIFLLKSTVSITLSLCMILGIASITASASDILQNEAYANHWGRSDLRAYLNGTEKEHDTLPYDTTHDTRKELGYYESQFTDEEYALVQPYKYSTRDFKNNSTYSTVDKFWLPSANINNSYPEIHTFASEDISTEENAYDIPTERIIPAAYLPANLSWMRTPNETTTNNVAVVKKGLYPYSTTVVNQNNIAAAFKIDISTISFAAIASATRNTSLHSIMGSDSFGKNDSAELPDYGMYLKQASNEAFEATQISFDSNSNSLSISFSGGVEGQYIVVQAFKNDNLTAITNIYTAVTNISSGSTSANIDISNWRISSLDDLTLKIWMEDASNGASLAKATTPTTFVGANKGSDGEMKNLRVFAMNNELQTSWGTLSSLDDSVGENPTNQKIYFGKDENNVPLQFWIAGRETYDSGKSAANGDGEISKSGNIMTLYQAKAVESRSFNASTADHEKTKNILKAQDFSFEAPSHLMYDASPKSATITESNDLTDIGNITVKYFKSGANAPLSTAPTDSGTYTVKIDVTESNAYYAATNLTDPMWTFTISPLIPQYQAPTLTPQAVMYGSTLSDITLTKDILGEPTNIDNMPLDGTWSWQESPSTSVGDVGSYVFTAIFTPYDVENIDWTNLTITGTGATVQNGVLAVDIPVIVLPLEIYPQNTNLTPELSATRGQTLGDLQTELAEKIGSFKDKNGAVLNGLFSWEASNSTPVGELGLNTFVAVFTPADTLNYDWTTINGFDSESNTVKISVKINVTALPTPPATPEPDTEPDTEPESDSADSSEETLENDPSAPTPDLPDPSAPAETETETESKSEKVTDEAKSGCGSTASLSVLAIIAIIGTATGLKKKED